MLKTIFKNALRMIAVLLFVGAFLLASAPNALADDTPATSSGILPLADYSGDLFERSYMLGDIDGKRSEWAEKGFTFDINYNQYFQAVVDGGKKTSSHYGGTLDYNVTLDLDRMGIIPGGLFSLRAVSRYGRSVNGISGAAIPVNTDATHPTTSPADKNVTYLPMINYTQFLSEKFAIGFGKYDTYDSANEFAGGRGRTQWMNQNFTMPISPALIVPYSTMGGMVLIMPTENLTITGMVGTIKDTSKDSGFGYLNDGSFGLVNITYQYQIGELPGGFGEMFGYGWDSDFGVLNSRLNFGSSGLTATTQDYTWFNSIDIWQYLWVENDSEEKVDISNGKQDLEGIGIFFRHQIADEDTNPIEYIVSGGVNGKGLIPRRDNDTMGIGYSYTKLQELRLGNIIGIDDSSDTWEFFYNIELTPAMHLTLDAQIANSALPNTDTATILGSSLNIVF